MSHDRHGLYRREASFVRSRIAVRIESIALSFRRNIYHLRPFAAISLSNLRIRVHLLRVVCDCFVIGKNTSNRCFRFLLIHPSFPRVLLDFLQIFHVMAYRKSSSVKGGQGERERVDILYEGKSLSASA